MVRTDTPDGAPPAQAATALSVRHARPMSAIEIYGRVVAEGRERLYGGSLSLVSRGFIAGSTIVFGIVALGIVYQLVAQSFGEHAGDLAGSIAFGIGLVFLVIGRSELFSENFLDPVAAAVEDGGPAWPLLARLWIVSLVMNLLGGAALAALLGVRGSIPDGGHEPLVAIARETLELPSDAAFVRAVAAGALLTLMTWLLQSASSPGARIAIAWIVGTFVALGPFNHVVVTELHLIFGELYGVEISLPDHASTLVIATVGNMVGGLLLGTLTHLGQVKGGAYGEV